MSTPFLVEIVECLLGWLLRRWCRRCGRSRSRRRRWRGCRLLGGWGLRRGWSGRWLLSARASRKCANQQRHSASSKARNHHRHLLGVRCRLPSNGKHCQFSHTRFHGPIARSHRARGARPLLVSRVPPLRSAAARTGVKRPPRSPHPRLRLWHRQQPDDAAPPWPRRGIDITWSGLAYARGRGELRVARASATRLPFPTDLFDLVTSFDVLYAFDDEMERDALNEMYRVLRPGGQIIINVAALKILTGNHSVLGGEVRRYSARGASQPPGANGLHSSAHHLHEFLTSATRRWRPLRPAPGRPSGIDRRDDRSFCASQPSPLGPARRRSVALKVIDMPLGSSLLVGRKSRDRTVDNRQSSVVSRSRQSQWSVVGPSQQSSETESAVGRAGSTADWDCRLELSTVDSDR